MTEENTKKLEEVKLDDKKQAAEGEDIVDPWNVTSTTNTGVNYDKLIGINLLNNSLVAYGKSYF